MGRGSDDVCLTHHAPLPPLSLALRLTRHLIHHCEEIMRPFLQKRLIDLLPSSRSGADAGGDGEQAAGGGGGGGGKKRKAASGAAKGGGDSDAEGEEEEEEETATAAAAAGGGVASQLKGCDVFSALLKVGGHKPLPCRW